MNFRAANRETLPSHWNSLSRVVLSVLLVSLEAGCLRTDSPEGLGDDSGLPDASGDDAGRDGGGIDDAGVPDAATPGTLDRTFGDGGIAVILRNAEGRAVVLQSDGK